MGVAANEFESVSIRLRAISRSAAERGGPKAAEAMGRVLAHGIQVNELRRFTHPAGTPTTSPKGQPPARVTGSLARSIRQEPVSGGKPVGPFRYETTVGPTIVYGRIQELGGWSGKGHNTYLPPRPYIVPATIRLRGQIGEAAVKAFRKEVERP